MCGVLKVDERLLVEGSVVEELLLWLELNTRYVEMNDSSSPVRGSKLKKGTVLRVKRRRWKDDANRKAGCFFFVEDAKAKENKICC
jgi:hypothetical protein